MSEENRPGPPEYDSSVPDRTVPDAAGPDFSRIPGSRVTVRFFAAAKAAAGTEQELVPSPSPATLGALLRELEGRHGPALTRVLTQCSFLVDEVSAQPPDAAIAAGSIVDILPPFAGG